MPSDADLLAMQQMVGEAMRTVGRSLEDLAKKSKDSSGPGGGFTQLNSLFVGMTKNLVGPVGLAAAVYSVTKSLESFAVGRIQLQNFSRDVGLSVPMVNAMGKAMNEAGISVDAQTQSIAKLGSLIKDLAARGMGSELATLLRETSQNSPAAAREIQALIETARTNADKALTDTIAILTRSNKEVRSYRAAQLGIAESHLEAMKHTQEEMDKVYVADIDAARRWHSNWEIISLGISNTWSRLYERFLQTVGKIPQERFNELAKELGKEGFKAHPKSLMGRIESGDWSGGSGRPAGPDIVPDWLQNALKFLGVGGGASFPPVDAPATFDERFRATDFSGRSRTREWVGAGLKRYQSVVDWLNERDVPGLQEKDKSVLWKLHEAIRPPDIESILDQMMPVNPLLFLKHAATQYSRGGSETDFANRFSAIWDTPGGMNTDASARGRELIEIERDSNKTLIDIRDAIQQAFGVIGGRPGSGPGRYSGGQPGSGYTAERLGLGGQGGKIDMQGGKMSPTGYYYPGTSTVLGGVVGSNSASRGPGQHQGDDFMMPHGSNLYATKDGVVESYGVDNFGGKTMRIRHSDGSTTSYLHMSERGVPVGTRVSGGQIIGKSGTANTVPHLHLEMRNPKGELVEPSTTLGVRRQVSGSWFNDRSTASGADASRVAGIALPTREGLGKNYLITGPDGRTMTLPQIDVGPAAWTGRGIDFSAPAARQLGYDPTNKSFTYSLVDDRAAIDRATQARGSPVDANMNATIDFKNMPSWVRSSINDNGKFKNLRVTRSTPQAGKASSPWGDTQTWSYE